MGEAMRVFYIAGPDNICLYSVNLDRAVDYLCRNKKAVILVEPGEMADRLLGHKLMTNGQATIKVIAPNTEYLIERGYEAFLFRDSTQGFSIKYVYSTSMLTSTNPMLITYA